MSKDSDEIYEELFNDLEKFKSEMGLDSSGIVEYANRFNESIIQEINNCCDNESASADDALRDKVRVLLMMKYRANALREEILGRIDSILESIASSLSIVKKIDEQNKKVMNQNV